MRVEMDAAEIELIAIRGVLRRLRGLRQNRDRYGFDGDGWRVDINGVGAELAVAKLLAAYPTGLGLSGDVGRVEVRSTEYPDGALILHPADPDDRPFVLVTGQLPTYDVVGWVMAGDAKRKAYWRTDRRHPAWFVPQGALHPIDAVAVAALSLAAIPDQGPNPPGAGAWSPATPRGTR